MSYNSLIQPYMDHYYRQPCLEPSYGPCCEQEEVEIEICKCKKEKPCCREKRERCCSPARQLPPQLECCEEEVKVQCCRERDCHCRKRRKNTCGCRPKHHKSRRSECGCRKKKEKKCCPEEKCSTCEIKVKVCEREPKMPCNECQSPWINGYPWITSTWYGRNNNCNYY